MRMDHVHARVRVFVPARGRARGMQQQENFIELRVHRHALILRELGTNQITCTHNA